MYIGINHDLLQHNACFSFICIVCFFVVIFLEDVLHILRESLSVIRISIEYEHGSLVGGKIVGFNILTIKVISYNVVDDFGTVRFIPYGFQSEVCGFVLCLWMDDSFIKPFMKDVCQIEVRTSQQGDDFPVRIRDNAILSFTIYRNDLPSGEHILCGCIGRDGTGNADDIICHDIVVVFAVIIRFWQVGDMLILWCVYSSSIIIMDFKIHALSFDVNV